MAMTLDELAAIFDELDIHYERRDDDIVFGSRTDQYVNPRGDKVIMLILKLEENGEYLKIFSPGAFSAKGPHKQAVLEACLMFQWKTKLLQFEYDASDGELRPIVEFPLEDGKATPKQLSRCVRGIVYLVDQFAPTFEGASREGVIDFGDRRASEPEGQAQALRRILRKLEASGGDPQQIAVLRELLGSLEGAGSADGTPPTEV